MQTKPNETGIGQKETSFRGVSFSNCAGANAAEGSKSIGTGVQACDRIRQAGG
jgi:hypothetical protein